MTTDARQAGGANERVLAASRLFASLEPELVGALARGAVRVKYAKGEYVWHAGTPSTHFAVIASGLVKIARATADGGETILALFGPRESVGDVAVLGAKPYPADAVALTDVEVLRVEASTVRSAFDSSPALLLALNASLIEHAQALQEKIRIMSAGKVEKRLATLLLHLASRFGDELDDGSTLIPIHVSRAECARLVGATIETTIRTFSRWQKKGLVTTTPDGFAIGDVSALTAITRA
jgi:CRP-like cAMP-binding protein